VRPRNWRPYRWEGHAWRWREVHVGYVMGGVDGGAGGWGRHGWW